MMEIRKWTGLSFDELTALYRAVEEIGKMLTATYQLGTPHLEAQLPNGKMCFVLVHNHRSGHEGSGMDPILGNDLVKMTKIQSKGAEFTVLVVIKGNGFLKTVCAMDAFQLGKDHGAHDKYGMLSVGPAIWSRLDYALGRVSKAEPLHFTIEG